MYTEQDNIIAAERHMHIRAAQDMPGLRVRCDGSREGWGLTDYPLASVYAPLQTWRNLYDEETAWSRGTLFAELDMPFLCGGMTEGGRGNG